VVVGSAAGCVLLHCAQGYHRYQRRSLCVAPSCYKPVLGSNQSSSSQIHYYPRFLGAKSDLRHPSSLRSQAPKQTSYPQFRGTHQSSLWGSRSYHAHLPYFDHFQSHRCCPLSSNPHEANLTEASSQLPI
ncbi:unnamed protein product, partial [Arabidopsis halleri]